MNHPKLSDPTTWTDTISMWSKKVRSPKGLKPMADLSYDKQLRWAKRAGAQKVGRDFRVPPGAKDPRVKPGVRR